MKDICKIEGFSVTMVEGAGSTVQLSAVQCDSFNLYESDFITLARINVSTIIMAFKQQSPNVKYIFKRSQNTLDIEFLIDLDFLPPFSESITLQKIHGYQGRMKIINKQLKFQVQELEVLLSKFKISNFQVNEKSQSVLVNNGQLWADDLAQGSHLVEISGLLTYDYNQSYYQVEEYNLSNRAFPVQVSVEEEGKTTIVEIFNIYFGPEYSYQQPFSFTLLLTLKQEGKFLIKQSKDAKFVGHTYFSNIIASAKMISL